MSEPQNIDAVQPPQTQSVADIAPDTRASQMSQMPLPAPQPPQPQAGQPQAGQQTAPSTPNGQPTGQPTPTAQPQHKRGLFDRVLEGMAGGPTIVNGQEQPMSRGNLTAHILAGAITGIIQGAGKGYQAPIGPAGTRSGQIAAAAGGAFDATGKAQEDIRNKPQEQANQKQAQLTAQDLVKYNTMKRTIDLHGAMIALGNSTRESQDTAEAPGKALVAGADASSDANPAGPPLISDRGLTHTEALKKYPNLSENNFILMGHQDMLNPDGTPQLDKDGIPHREPLFAVVNPAANMTLTQDMKDEFGNINPEIKRIPVNARVSLGAFLDMNTQHINLNAVIGGMTRGAEAIDTITGTKVTDIDKKVKSDPVLRKNAAAIAQYATSGIDPDEVVNEMRKDHVDPNVISHYALAMGLNERDKAGVSVAQKLAQHRVEMKDEEDEEKKKVEDANAKRTALNNSLAEKQYATNLKNKVLDPPTSNTSQFPNQWADPKTGFNYDLSHPSAMIVDGNLDPSQLTKRAVGAGGYNSTLEAANNYSMARYGRPFDFAKASTDYGYAKGFRAQDTLKLVQSLTGDNNKNDAGSIGQLQGQLRALGNTPIPKVNDLKNWAIKNAGQPGVTDFQATMLGVADEMGRILGGGVATDSSRQEANAIIDKGFSTAQGEGAIKAIRGLFANRYNAVIGNNSYLNKWYGKMANPLAVTTGQTGAPAPAPDGTIVNTPKGQQIKQGGAWVPYKG